MTSTRTTDDADQYDFNNYPLDHPLYNVSNRKALFKDKLNSVPMQEFVGQRPKRYPFLCTDKGDKNVLDHTRPVEKKTPKSVKRKVKDDQLHLAHYCILLALFVLFTLVKLV